MAQRFTTQRHVQFADTDMGGIVHFSNYFRYMEEAEHAFLNSLDIPIVDEQDTHTLSWPRVSASFEYMLPLRYPGTIDIHIQISKLGTSSITYTALFEQAGAGVARGSVTAVCCAINEGNISSTPIPDDLRARLSAFVSEK